MRQWIKAESARHPELVRLAYFGSYARGDWGVGSDLDLVAVVNDSTEPFHSRALTWDLLSLPVPADLIIYTAAEWERLLASQTRLAQTLAREAIWLYP